LPRNVSMLFDRRKKGKDEIRRMRLDRSKEVGAMTPSRNGTLHRDTQAKTGTLRDFDL